MKTLQKILNFFSSGKTKNISPIADERNMDFDEKLNDVGSFIYEEDGFIFQMIPAQQKIQWADIERLIAYKKDFLTTDEVCLDILFNNRKITITEATPGWYQFIQKTKFIFPGIPKNWDSEILQPAFALNLKVLYQRTDREIPDENNFYASFSYTTKTKIKELLELNNWTVRKSGSTDFEFENSWTTLTLEGNDNEPLLNGMVAFHNDNIMLLNRLFNALACEYVYEFYDKDNNLILEKISS
ncbi:hypothetical protein [Limnovirga soli]|uniref:Uncharacterized protein n=1 Tax=Limnovirga soli TaxID=2656915 RepID=A0A8J8FIC8_9BACT|nr:hypothetical protein [Limnovirga soli]NNV57157.1 hypothetical protein [Limnovirga soli]